MEYESTQRCRLYDVREKNLGCEITSLDPDSEELRLIEVKGLAEAAGTILLTPNERQVAEDRRDCYRLYVVTDCATKATLREPIKDRASFTWHEVPKVQHFCLEVNSLTTLRC
jgi:hypothetical protein